MGSAPLQRQALDPPLETVNTVCRVSCSCCIGKLNLSDLLRFVSHLLKYSTAAITALVFSRLFEGNLHESLLNKLNPCTVTYHRQ